MSRLLVVLAAVELIVIMVVGWLLGPAMDARVVPGVWVWDVSLGGMTPEEAGGHLESALPLHQSSVVLVGPEGQQWLFSPAELGMSVNAEATLDAVYHIGHNPERVAKFRERFDVMMSGKRLAPVLSWNREATTKAIASIAAELERPAQDAAVRLDGATLSLVAGDLGRRVEVSDTLAALTPYLLALEPVEIVVPVTELAPGISDQYAQQALSMAEQILKEPLTLLVSNPREGDPGPWTVAPDVLARMLIIQLGQDVIEVGLDEAALAQFLGPLALALYREPVDATFHFDSSTIELVVTSPSAVGREMDVPASVALINQKVQNGEHWVSLVTTELPPSQPDTLTAADLGVRELVAVGESYFTGSSSARDRNIRLSASKFDGVVIAPGETFSFNEHLGEVTSEEGYDESYVIIGDRTVLGVGGGICQVATTAFRAAYFGGYPITERWPHAYRVGYYELGGFGPGFDATIYSPIVDLRFVNDTPHHILIHTEVDAARSRLRFMFYSTKDGRTVEQVGPEWGAPIPPGEPVYEYDASLPSGSVRQLEKPINGLTAVLGRVVRDAEGNVLREDQWVSKFIPWPARYRYGPGYTPPSSAEVIGTPEP
jgi:vancomycin resistance protein YoaR